MQTAAWRRDWCLRSCPTISWKPLRRATWTRCSTSPMGLRLTKEGLNMAIDAAGLEAAMAIENRNQLMCSRTNDAREGMRAFLEKRAPEYTGT